MFRDWTLSSPIIFYSLNLERTDHVDQASRGARLFPSKWKWKWEVEAGILVPPITTSNLRFAVPNFTFEEMEK
jgi:hypothetical protein